MRGARPAIVLVAASFGVVRAFAGADPDLGPVVDLAGPSAWLQMSRQLQELGISVSFEGLTDSSAIIGTPTAHWLQGSTDHERVAGAVAALRHHEGRARGSLVTVRGHDIIVATVGVTNPLEEIVRWNGRAAPIDVSVAELASAMTRASGCTVQSSPPHHGKPIAIEAGRRTARDVLVDLIAADGRGGLVWSLVGSPSPTSCYWVLNVSKVWTAEDRAFSPGVGASW